MNDSSKSMFDGKDRITVVTAAMDIENKEDKTNAIYPNQATLTTNTKEQKTANALLSNDIGGDFMGNIQKKGNVIFVLNSPAKDIQQIKIIIEAPHNQEFEKIGNPITFDMNFSDQDKVTHNTKEDAKKVEKDINANTNKDKGNDEYNYVMIDGIAVKLNNRGYTPNGKYYPQKDIKSKSYVNTPPGDKGDILDAKGYDGFSKKDFEDFEIVPPDTN